MQLLKTIEFQRLVRANVVDEAHLAVEWYVNFIIRVYSWGVPNFAPRCLYTPPSHISVISATMFCNCGVNVITKKINTITLMQTNGDLLAEKTILEA